MEKLIVRNFGPIEEAEIDLAKYVVFIGDTSTGKSVLAKLISIFRDSMFTYKLKVVKDVLENVLEFDFKQNLINLNIDFEYKNSEIIYNSPHYRFEIKNGRIKYIGSKGYKKADILKNLNLTTHDFILKSSGMFKTMGNLEFVNSNHPTYFPAERILISIVGNSISGLWANNVALPYYFKDFAARFEIAKSQNPIVKFRNFGFEYRNEKNIDKVLMDGKSFELSKMSSGIQSLVPMLITFDYEASLNGIRTFLIEEPELNLFPSKQKLLIDYLISRTNEKYNALVITTHSPYILTCLNTLLLAKNTYNEKPELAEKINEIVPGKRWISYEDIYVYEVSGGKVRLIKDAEFKSIDSNSIDVVSNEISKEFDELIEIRYA